MVKIQTMLNLEKEQHAFIKKKAKDDKKTMSQIIRELIEKEMEYAKDIKRQNTGA